MFPCVNLQMGCRQIPLLRSNARHPNRRPRPYRHVQHKRYSRVKRCPTSAQRNRVNQECRHMGPPKWHRRYKNRRVPRQLNIVTRRGGTLPSRDLRFFFATSTRVRGRATVRPARRRHRTMCGDQFRSERPIPTSMTVTVQRPVVLITTVFGVVVGTEVCPLPFATRNIPPPDQRCPRSKVRALPSNHEPPRERRASEHDPSDASLRCSLSRFSSNQNAKFPTRKKYVSPSKGPLCPLPTYPPTPRGDAPPTHPTKQRGRVHPI